MSAEVFTVGSGYDSGNTAATTSFITVPAGVTAAMTTAVVATWSATALETPPTVQLSGQGWTTLVAPRTDGTMGWAVYSRTGLAAGDVVFVVLGATRFHVLLDAYLKTADVPVPGAVSARVATVFTNLAPGVALAQGPGELALVVSVERTTAFPTTVTNTGGATQIGYKEGTGSTISSVFLGTAVVSSSPSASATITYSSNSANGAGVQLAVPVPVASGLHPTDELVAVAWLKAAVPYLGSRVATELPADNASWAASGFTTVMAAGGNAEAELQVSLPLVSVDTYGAAPNGGRPPWNLANQQAEQIKRATWARPFVPRWVTLPSGYLPARVLNVVPRSEPRRVPGDQGNYARYQQDLEIWWAE